MSPEDKERIEAAKNFYDEEAVADSYGFDPKSFKSWREAETRLEEYGKKPELPQPERPPNYDNDVLREIVRYKEQGLLLPKYNKIHAQIVETYKKHGYLYHERNHVLSLINKAAKWALGMLGVLGLIVLYIWLIVRQPPNEGLNPEFHLIVGCLFVLALLFCALATYREYYRFIHECVTVSATLIIVEKANNKWLNLRGTGGNWPTRHYGSAKTLKQSAFEQWIAKRSQPITVDAAGNQDIEELHNRPHVKDAERLKLAVEISSYMSGGAHNIAAIDH